MQLWLCLHLHELAIQCLPQRRPQALAVLDKQRIYAANAAASLLGVEAGMDQASTRAIAADTPLQLLQRDPEAEKEVLQTLCCWAYGVTPHLYPFKDDCLMLEVSGSLRLFGGIDAIKRHCQRGLACRGFSALMGLGETPLGAWAFARWQSEPKDNIALAFTERLKILPIHILTSLHEQFSALQRSGLRTLGELMSLPPASLSKRCGHDFTALLQQLTGSVISPPVHFHPPSCFIDSYPLGYPVSDQTELVPALEQLLQSLENYLRQRQLQTRILCWHFLGPDDYRQQLEVRTSEALTPSSDWLRLTRLRLEKYPFEQPVELIQLRVSNLENIQPESGSLFRHAGQNGNSAQLVDLLSTRLGSQAVSGLRCRDAHLPEHSLANVAPGTADLEHKPPGAQRPFWLLGDPEPLRSEGEHLLFWGGRLELIYGPERIEDGWWEKATSRDYFVARNAQGQRFWVYHERRQKRWFLHGLFA